MPPPFRLLQPYPLAPPPPPLYVSVPYPMQVAALLDKRARRKVQFEADYVGFECPDEFVVGKSVVGGVDLTSLLHRHASHYPPSHKPHVCPPGSSSGYGTNYSQLWRFLPYIAVPTPCARPSPHPFPSPCLSLICMPFTGYGIDYIEMWRFLPYIAVPAHCTLLPCPTSHHQAQRSPLYVPCLQAMAPTAARCGAFCHPSLCRRPVPCFPGMLPKTSCSALCPPLLASRLRHRLQRDVALSAIHRRAHPRGRVASSSRGGGAAAPPARAARAGGHPKCGWFRAGVRVGR